MLAFLADSRYKRNEQALYHTLLESARRRKSTLLTVAIVAACVWIGVRLPQGLADLREKRQLIRQLNEENATMKRENDRRREHVHRLETSPSEQEMEIRKQLKLAHPNDTTFMLPNGATPDAPTEPPPPEP
ncbi:MAG: FtsB family cell division protein [Bryobacteraceae bacterium]